MLCLTYAISAGVIAILYSDTRRSTIKQAYQRYVNLVSPCHRKSRFLLDPTFWALEFLSLCLGALLLSCW